MTDIDAQIKQLQNEIVALEKIKSAGYEVGIDVSEEYYFPYQHTVLRNFDGVLLAVISDEAAVRKYLHDKDSEEAV